MKQNNLTKYFALLIVFSFTIGANAYGQCAISASAGSGGSISPSGTNWFPPDGSARQTYSITADAGHDIADVIVDGSSVGAVSSYTFTQIHEDHTIEASFSSNMYYLGYTAGANGWISGTTFQIVSYGASGTAVGATPNTGYHFVRWSDYSTSNPRTDANVTENISVTANFAINTYTLTYTAGAGGSISGTSPQTVNYGANGTAVRAVANTGYHFVNWSDYCPDNPRTERVVTYNQSVTANFAPDMYTLTVNATNGTIAKNPNQSTYTYGASVQLTATPATGYTFANWSGDASGTTNPLTVTMNGNKNITAIFAAIPYTLTVNATNGTVAKNPNQSTYTYGVSVQLTATPATGYTFANWSGDASGSNNPTSVTINGNKTVTANFAISIYMLTLTVNSSGGGSVTGSGSVTHGVAQSITATANTGYQFVNWTVSAGTATIANPNSATTTVTLTSGNATVTANFVAIPQYNITLSANPSDGGTPSGGGTFYAGTSVTVTATPNAGYTFTNWTEGTTVVFTSASYTFTISGNRTIVANFTVARLTELYVSTSGSDVSGNGLITNPYATMEKARSVIQSYKTTYGISSDINVYLRGGIYNLSTTINFTSADNIGYKTTYKSYPGENAVINGGISVPANLWVSTGTNNIYKANLSSISSSLNIRQLYINDQRCIRARLYNNADLKIRSSNDLKSYIFNGTSILNSLAKPTEVEVMAFLTWQWDIVKVQSISSNIIKLDDEYVPSRAYDSVKVPYDVVYLENAKEFLDSPGEWYYDKTNNDLYLKPFDNNPPGSNAIIPLLDKIISGEGTSNLIFDGLTFCYATWSYPVNNDYHTAQASCYRNELGNIWFFIPGNIEFSHSDNIIFNNCTFKHLGAVGLCFKNTSANCTIQNGNFTDISADAIRIASNDELDLTNNITISDNTISNAGQEYKGSVGIFLGFVNTATVSNNDVSNLPYTGISVGFRWDISNTNLGNIKVQNNSIHDVQQELSDAGAIYNLGQHIVTGHSEISNNHIYNIPPNVSQSKLHAGIYLDQGSNNVTVKDNWGDRFELNDERNTDIFFNFNLNSEAQGNRFGTNNFGDNSFWIKKTRTDDNKPGVKSREPGFPPSYHISAECCGDMGVNFVDVDHDGRKDMVYCRKMSNGVFQTGVYLNKVDHWEAAQSNYLLPESCPTAIDGLKDAGVRFFDVDGDGFEDLIQYLWKTSGQHQIRAYKNTGSGWSLMSTNYNIPYPFAADYCGDLGARLVDVDADAGRLKDLIFYRDLGNGTFQRGVYLNNGSGWTYSNDSKYVPPVVMYKDGVGDLGVRFVDLDGDGHEDIIQYEWINSTTSNRSAFLKTSTGWQSAPNFLSPYPFSADGMGDLGARFVDVDWDGRKDIVYNRDLGNGTFQKGVYLNNGNGWTLSTDPKYIPPITLYKDGVGDQGVRFVDLNGDDHEDIIKGYWNSSSQLISDFYLNKARMFYNTVSPPSAKIGNQLSISSQVSSEIPDKYLLSQNYPNPFNPTTEIRYQLPAMSFVKLVVYDILGREVAILSDGIKNGGYYTSSFDGSRIASGIYFARLTAIPQDGDRPFIKVMKMLMVK